MISSLLKFLSKTAYEFSMALFRKSPKKDIVSKAKEIVRLRDMDVASLAEVVEFPKAFFSATSLGESWEPTTPRDAFILMSIYLPRREVESLKDYLALIEPSLYIDIVGEKGQPLVDKVKSQFDADEVAAFLIKSAKKRRVSDARRELLLLTDKQQDIWRKSALIPLCDGGLPEETDQIISQNLLPADVLPLYLKLGAARAKLIAEIREMESEPVLDRQFFEVRISNIYSREI